VVKNVMDAGITVIISYTGLNTKNLAGNQPNGIK
jgi:hypothetical protein